MGMELTSLNSKVQPENRLWMEGSVRNFGVRITISALNDAILTCVRLYCAYKQISVFECMAQLNSRESRTPGAPGIPDKLAELETVLQMASVLAARVRLPEPRRAETPLAMAAAAGKGRTGK